ncbi:hypothetical protein APY04_2298 [Hyphomicrobium sulfonivorans]|uniref:Uncharacterized protein n=1 Tax=Hyphomicrobium sulfonivorans TaxID=121290 RepID=A0A109BDQ7_HYPSL|nr:hypothetical protein [Hyphomicrobium sulfonivorans]KWT66891.1 hypothetical protein APY04_2298 [Hyphomicrobium sulfonivorans]
MQRLPARARNIVMRYVRDVLGGVLERPMTGTVMCLSAEVVALL